KISVIDLVVNRFKGIRCGLALSPEQISAARNDDDINVLALAADHTSEEDVKDIIAEYKLSRKNFHFIRWLPEKTF
ncbi:MAG: hypothetical protein UX22_C0019G0022, partial [Candidatus Jorgensenbacteria bacterium GW2011_GWA2_45_9]